MESKYKVKKLYEDTYVITDYGIEQGTVMMYLLIGIERALLIDSGYGGLDLNRITSELTDKPITVVLTHGHIDHAMGAYCFEKSYIHSADYEVYNRHKNSIRKMGFEGIGLKVKEKKLDSSAYKELIEDIADKPRGELLPIDDIAEFDLGGRKITWFPLRGHTLGSIVFYDEKYNALFEGDAALPGVWLFLPESLPLSEYRINLQKYCEFLESHNNPKRFGGHSFKPFNLKNAKNLLKCIDVALTDKKPAFHTVMPIGEADIMMKYGCLLFYNRKTL